MCYADYLPIGDDDVAPWRLRTRDGRGVFPERVSHQVVYGPGWYTVGNLNASGRTAEQAGAQDRRPEVLLLATNDSCAFRVFHRGDGCPQDLAAVVDSAGNVWPRNDWCDGILTTWDELLELNAPLVEVPVELLRAQLHQNPSRDTDRCGASA